MNKYIYLLPFFLVLIGCSNPYSTIQGQNQKIDELNNKINALQQQQDKKGKETQEKNQPEEIKKAVLLNVPPKSQRATQPLNQTQPNTDKTAEQQTTNIPHEDALIKVELCKSKTDTLAKKKAEDGRSQDFNTLSAYCKNSITDENSLAENMAQQTRDNAIQKLKDAQSSGNDDLAKSLSAQINNYETQIDQLKAEYNQTLLNCIDSANSAADKTYTQIYNDNYDTLYQSCLTDKGE